MNKNYVKGGVLAGLLAATGLVLYLNGCSDKPTPARAPASATSTNNAALLRLKRETDAAQAQISDTFASYMNGELQDVMVTTYEGREDVQRVPSKQRGRQSLGNTWVSVTNWVYEPINRTAIVNAPIQATENPTNIYGHKVETQGVPINRIVNPTSVYRQMTHNLETLWHFGWDSNVTTNTPRLDVNIADFTGTTNVTGVKKELSDRGYSLQTLEEMFALKATQFPVQLDDIADTNRFHLIGTMDQQNSYIQNRIVGGRK